MEKRLYGINYFEKISGDHNRIWNEIIQDKLVVVDRKQWEETCSLLNDLQSHDELIYKVLCQLKSDMKDIKGELLKLRFGVAPADL
jgi:hypothetical protein